MEKKMKSLRDIESEGNGRYRVLAVVKSDTLTRVKDEAAGEEVNVWPDLVFRELLAIILVCFVLIVASLLFNAPLEEPADPTKAPHLAKAPWYFVGLQEMLVYFDPWIAGVTIPGLIVIGLMTIPYLDASSPKSRYRKLIVGVFLFGVAFWFILIAIGAFFRGPAWEWYWPWEDWSVQKLTVTSLKNLSPVLGVILLAGYFSLGLTVPVVVNRKLVSKLGVIRYGLVMFLLLAMLGLVGKIFLRLIFGVKYMLTTPWFNI